MPEQQFHSSVGENQMMYRVRGANGFTLLPEIRKIPTKKSLANGYHQSLPSLPSDQVSNVSGVPSTKRRAHKEYSVLGPTNYLALVQAR